MIGAACSALIIPAELGQILLPEFTGGQEMTDNPGGFAALPAYAGLTLLGFVIFVVIVVAFFDVAPSLLHQPHRIWLFEITKPLTLSNRRDTYTSSKIPLYLRPPV